jgi:hypothetical protein
LVPPALALATIDGRADANLADSGPTDILADFGLDFNTVCTDLADFDPGPIGTADTDPADIDPIWLILIQLTLIWLTLVQLTLAWLRLAQLTLTRLTLTQLTLILLALAWLMLDWLVPLIMSRILVTRKMTTVKSCTTEMTRWKTQNPAAAHMMLAARAQVRVELRETAKRMVLAAVPALVQDELQGAGIRVV